VAGRVIVPGVRRGRLCLHGDVRPVASMSHRPHPVLHPMTARPWLANLVCPVSAERGREDVVRLTALLVAMLAGAYLLTRAVWIPIFLLVDFVVRGTGWRASWSPLRAVAHWLAARRRRPSATIDLAPKQFAARVGVVLTLGMSIAHPAAPRLALVLAGVLTAFALLESVGNVCAGCLVYTHVVLPWVRDRRLT
jgi:hypothetical protein